VRTTINDSDVRLYDEYKRHANPIDSGKDYGDNGLPIAHRVAARCDNDPTKIELWLRMMRFREASLEKQKFLEEQKKKGKEQSSGH
jgi:hypothetical protein